MEEEERNRDERRRAKKKEKSISTEKEGFPIGGKCTSKNPNLLKPEVRSSTSPAVAVWHENEAWWRVLCCGPELNNFQFILILVKA